MYIDQKKRPGIMTTTTCKANMAFKQKQAETKKLYNNRNNDITRHRHEAV